jgi:hypothetical protein
VKQVRTAVAVMVGVIALIIIAAAVLRPILPWLIVLFFLICILRIATRDI